MSVCLSKSAVLIFGWMKLSEMNRFNMLIKISTPNNLISLTATKMLFVYFVDFFLNANDTFR